MVFRDPNMMNGHSVKLKCIGTFRHKVSAAMVDKEALAGESLVRDVRVQFMPERTVTAVGKQRIKRRALIPGSLTWKIYDKPHKTTEEGEAGRSRPQFFNVFVWEGGLWLT